MIEVKNLSFQYTKQTPFIKDINFTVQKGEIFGFLGPSGAGKTTLQKILTGLITDYEGSAIVNGVNCNAFNKACYEQIGVDFEFSTLYEKLTAIENLAFFASLYKNPTTSFGELLEAVGLTQDANKKVSEYSKGMKSRLNFIKAILHHPQILFLDEPTSGLDPSNSQRLKELILQEKAKGKTIILTTHNMQDATELCDRVAFIVNGQICALDTPHQLIMSKGATKLKYSYWDGIEVFKECLLSEINQDKQLTYLIEHNLLLSIHSSEPTLNDIFIELTGRALL